MRFHAADDNDIVVHSEFIELFKWLLTGFFSFSACSLWFMLDFFSSLYLFIYSLLAFLFAYFSLWLMLGYQTLEND